MNRPRRYHRRRWVVAVAALASFPGCENAATTASAPDEAPAASAGTAAAADSTAPATSPEPSDPDKLRDKTFDDIKFEMETGGPYDRGLLTDAVRQLDGQRIRIRGYILPTARKRGIKQFVLVRDDQECCFGPGAALYDCILVTLEPGETTEFSMRPVAVEGRFRIEELEGPDGYPLAIYQMEGESVE